MQILNHLKIYFLYVNLIQSPNKEIYKLFFLDLDQLKVYKLLEIGRLVKVYNMDLLNSKIQLLVKKHI
jgi:hypothetical protein